MGKNELYNRVRTGTCVCVFCVSCYTVRTVPCLELSRREPSRRCERNRNNVNVTHGVGFQVNWCGCAL